MSSLIPKAILRNTETPLTQNAVELFATFQLPLESEGLSREPGLDM